MKPSHLSASILLACGLLLGSTSSWAQPKSGLRLPEPVDREEAARAGKALVSDLLSQRPEGESRTSGTLKTRYGQGTTREVRVEFSVVLAASNVISRYVAIEGGTNKTELTIIQTPGSANKYLLATTDDIKPKLISGAELSASFAGSEFSIADLGLGFLHWPKQLVTRNEMSRGQSCAVLESYPDKVLPNGYSRVESWIASQKPGIVIVKANAYDEKGRLLKQFYPKNLEKVEGQWQLQRMEMTNRQTGARSTIDFDLGVTAR